MSKSVPKPPPEGWEDPYRPPKRPFRWIGTLLFLVVVYVLSVGPASALAARGTIPSISMDRIYKPLDMLADWSPRVKQALFWYVELWIGGKNTTRSKP
jgi:hypothetical protein